MNPQERIHHNLRLLFWGRALVELRLLSAVIVLFYLHRGLGLDTVFYMSIVWSLTALVTEVPSGYLADRMGRKRTLLLGVVLALISWIITFFAHGFWPFVLSFIFMSSSFSCFSGTEEALLYESLEHAGKEKEMNKRNGKQLSARSLPDIFFPAIGAWIASGLLESQFQLLIGLNILFTIGALIIWSRLTEPPRKRHIAELEIGVFRQSVNTIRNEPWLLRVAFNKLLVFIAVFTIWRTAQPFLTQHGLGVTALGVFYVAFQIIDFSGTWFAGAIEQRIGTTRIISGSAVVMILMIPIAVTATNPLVIAAALAVSLGLNGMRESVFGHAVNKRLKSHSRATTLSNLNVLKSFLDIPLLWIAGFLSNQSLTYPLLLAAAMCSVALLFFPIRARELSEISVSTTTQK